MQREVNRIEEKNRKPIIMGDLNGRVGQNFKSGHGVLGRFGGEKVLNGNGRRILEFCTENNLRIGNTYFKHKRIHQITYEGEGRDVKSIIDYIIYPKEMSRIFKDVKVIRGAEASTDHRLLVADTRIRNNIKRRKRKIYERVKIEELREPGNRKRYQEIIGERLRGMQEFREEDNIDEMWREIKEIIMKTAEEICGKRRINTGMKRTKWWNEETKQVVKEKKDSWKKFLRTGSIEDYREYIHKRNEAKMAVRKAKEESWKEFGNEVENNYKENKKAFWNIIKNLRGKRGRRIRNIRNEENKIESQQGEIMKIWKRYYEEKFKGELEEDINNVNGLGDEENVPIRAEEEQESISIIEVELAVDKIKMGKAAGYDDVAPEMIKWGGMELIKKLWDLFKRIWEEERIPKEWEYSIIIPIYKKGETSKCDNYRAICLSSVVLKIYTSILERKLRKEVEEDLEEEQGAFRPE